MNYFDDDNPVDDKEFTCNVCDKPIDEPGFCSAKCWRNDNL